MPRINRVRITGSRYEGFQKRHEDSLFHLASDHTLFTMQNGNGKGVMLQLISQIMLPGTPWGANNGNKVERMFYDRYNSFVPYTFHVVLEWRLDSNPNERLLTGICFSAHRKKTLEDIEGKVGLKYFLYTHTHDYRGGRRFTLEDLPLYDASTREVLEYDEMKSFVDHHRQSIRYYSKSSVSSLNSDYYQYLASHGIYRSEWEIMKSINRSEGGLEKYFSKAKDNQALFDKLILPAVSESISSRSEENEGSLLNMFVDTIKIAENLPELLSRTEDLNRLLQMVQPLLDQVELGIKYTHTMEMVRERGNNYVYALEERLGFLENELGRSEGEREKVEASIRDLNYEEDNLKYAKRVRELKEKKERKTELNRHLEGLKKNLYNLKEEERELELNREYLSYQEIRKEYQNTSKRVQRLEESFASSNLKEEISQKKREMEEDWPALRRFWSKSSQEYSAYSRHLEVEREELIQREMDLRDTIKKKDLQVSFHHEKRERLEKRKKDLATRFHPLSLKRPNHLLEQLFHHLESAEEELEELKKEGEDIEAQIETCREEIKRWSIEEARARSTYEIVEKDFQEQEKREENVFTQVVRLLNLDRYKEVYSQEWLKERMEQLKRQLEEREDGLQDLKNQNHGLEVDLALNDKEYWIASYDQKRLYQRISAMDIKVFYGSDFLLNYTKDREDLLDEYPLLPYGLVVNYEADWRKIERNLTHKDLYRTPVPIFINFLLDGEESRSFKLVQGREEDFIRISGAFKEWFKGLYEQQRQLKETIAMLEGKMRRISETLYTSQEILQEESSASLAREISRLKEEIERLLERIQESNESKKRLEDEKRSRKKKVEKKEVGIKKLEEDQKEIEEFAKEIMQLEGEEREIEVIQEELSTLEEGLKDTLERQRQNRTLKQEIDHDYKIWLKDLKGFLAKIREILPGVAFNQERAEESQSNVPHLYDYHDSKVSSHYQRIEDLKKREEEKNIEIGFLRKDMDRLLREMQEREDVMNELDPNWPSYSLGHYSKAEVKVELEGIRGAIEKEKRKIGRCEEEITFLAGEIHGKERELQELKEEIRGDYQKTAQSWLDVDLHQKEIEIKEDLQESRDYLQKLKEMISDYQEKVHQIDSLIKKLVFFELDPKKGEYRGSLRDEIRANPEEAMEDWVQDYREIEDKIHKVKNKTQESLNQFKHTLNEQVKSTLLKTLIREKIIQDFERDAFRSNFDLLTSFREYLLNELNSLHEDKTKAENARNQWAQRSAMYVMRMISSIQEMIRNMVYHNQRGHAFPLVRLRRSDLLPEKEEDILQELKEYFVSIVEEFNEKELRVDSLTKSELKEYTGDAALFSKAIRGQYPVLSVYKMTDKNEFLYAKPEDYYYADWESVIQGRGDSPEGSGGQSLSINAFIMMMLLNYKKQGLERSNPWTVLFLDNPFGKASAAHVLDPIFEIANKLNFQIIAFSAPEIIKTQTSERFPVFWALDILDDEKGHGVVKGQVIYGERIRETQSVL